MKVFISWSGTLSLEVAVLLREFLPNMIQQLQPYVSSEDIDKGERWFADIAGHLGSSEFGICCLTRENLSAPWVLFEAGALSKSLNRSGVVPFLIGLDPSELPGPLAQFQAVRIDHSDFLRLMRSINGALGEKGLEAAQLDRAVEKWWPELEERLQQTIEASSSTAVAVPARTEEGTLEEILRLIAAAGCTSFEGKFSGALLLCLLGAALEEQRLSVSCSAASRLACGSTRGLN